MMVIFPVSMDLETDALWAYYRHIFPDFSPNHMHIYLLLWKGEPKGGEELIGNSGLARGTVYKILRELIARGLIKKTSHRPVKYLAENPVRAYSMNSKKVIARLQAGCASIKKLLCADNERNREIVIMAKGGGAHKILSRKTRSEITDELELREIRKAADRQLMQLCSQKSRVWESYR